MRRLIFGIPAQERLKKQFEKALASADFEMVAQGREYGLLIDRLQKIAPLSYEVVRQDDMINDMASGDIDLGIIGNDAAMECDSGRSGDVTDEGFVGLERLGIAQCSFWFAAAQDDYSVETITNLSEKRIATSYPNILQSVLKESGIDPATVTIVERSGKVERTVSRGLADIAFDIVETGGSILDNGLKPCLNKIRESFALVAASTRLAPRERRMAEYMAVRLATVSPYLQGHMPERAEWQDCGNDIRYIDVCKPTLEVSRQMVLQAA